MRRIDKVALYLAWYLASLGFSILLWVAIMEGVHFHDWAYLCIWIFGACLMAAVLRSFYRLFSILNKGAQP